MTGIRYTILGFATYYIALSISNESLEGPWGVLQKLRQSTRFRKDDWAGRGIRCIVCVSLYAGLLMALLAALLGWVRWRDVVVVAPACAGLSVSIDKFWKAR